jgi:hypothetical protein
VTIRRVNIKKVLEDPEKRKELMVRTIIATQALEGRDLTTEQAEEVYEKIQEEVRKKFAEENPGREMVRNDEASLESAMNTFERFHDKESGASAYPFNGKKEGIFPLPESVQWPKGVRTWGNAIRTLYESDKWHPKGDTTQYYHDHDKGVTFYTPDDGADAEPFMHDWPEEVALLGQCIGFVVEESDGNLAEGIMKGKNILVASPDGWVDPKRPEKVFLAIINLNGGGVEGVICGPNLRITAHGIEG